MTPKQRHREGVLMRSGICALTRLGPCRGRLQSHHLIPVQRIIISHSLANAETHVEGNERLRGWDIEQLTADSTNGICLCELHHGKAHELIPADVPNWPDLVAWAEERGLGWSLDRDFAVASPGTSP